MVVGSQSESLALPVLTHTHTHTHTLTFVVAHPAAHIANPTFG